MPQSFYDIVDMDAEAEGVASDVWLALNTFAAIMCNHFRRFFLVFISMQPMLSVSLPTLILTCIRRRSHI